MLDVNYDHYCQDYHYFHFSGPLPNLVRHAHLCLYFLPFFQIQPVLVSLLVSIELLQLLGQGSCSLAGFFFQPVIFLHLCQGQG